MYRHITTIFIVLVLAGCAGTMNGMVRNTGERVTINYQQGMEHDDLQVVMPDGETFNGKVVMVGHSSGLGWGFGSALATSSTGASAYGAGSTLSILETYTGSMQGVLFGDRKHTMSCKFQYADSSGVTTSGGVGLCEISDGRVIDVQW
jgi:hypothetical protein